MLRDGGDDIAQRKPSGAKSISQRALPILLIPLSGCTVLQSALDPAGEEAAAVFQLFLFMVVGSALIWVAVVGLLFHPGRRGETPLSAEKAGRLIAWGGVAFPVVVLLALLA